MSNAIKPVIILIKPQLGENIGMVARAMFNCGIEELRLVKPRDGWPNDRAMATSAECLKLMPEVQVFDSLADASHDISYIYATTARPRDMQVKVQDPMEVGAESATRASNGEKVAFVFGGESSGLHNTDVAQCNSVITIPLNPDFTSLNLAQAVLLVSWEWRKHSGENLIPAVGEVNSPLASQHHVNKALEVMEEELEKRGFFKSKGAESTVRRNLYTMFNRISMNEQEVQMLHGIVRCLSKFSIKK